MKEESFVSISEDRDDNGKSFSTGSIHNAPMVSNGGEKNDAQSKWDRVVSEIR
jgi:hypothetical protein